MRYAWIGILALSGCALLQPSHNASVPQPARPVDLQRYLGHWYEFARYDSSFEHACEEAAADYSTLPGGLIRVVNTCRADTTGALERAVGRARPIPGSANAKLRVSFFGPFFIGRYWVLDHAPDYAWSIVGEPTGGYLWILTRAAHPSPGLCAALIARVAALGYDTGSLHLTWQPAGT